MADVMRYVPGIGTHQGENNRDQVIIRGNSSSADFFLNGVRDDVQYYRDLYNLERVEALKGPNAMIFGRGGGGGVVNRVTKEAVFQPVARGHPAGRHLRPQARRRRRRPAAERQGRRPPQRHVREAPTASATEVDLERYGVNPTLTIAASDRTHDHARLRAPARHARGRSRHHVVPGRARPTSTSPPSSATPTTATCGPTSTSAPRPSSTRRARCTIRNRTLFGDYDRFYQNYVPGAVNADKTPGRADRLQQRHRSARTSSTRRTSIYAASRPGAVRHTLLGGRRDRPPAHRQLPQHRLLQRHRHLDLRPLRPTPPSTRRSTFRQSATDADNHLRTNVAAAYVQDQVELSPQAAGGGGRALRPLRPRVPQQPQRRHPRPRGRPRLAARGHRLQADRRRCRSTAATACPTCPSSGDQFSSLTTITEQVEPEKFTNYELGVKWDVAAGPLPDHRRLPAGPHQHPLDRSERSDPDRADGQPAHQRLRAGRQRTRHAGLAHRRRLRLPGRVRHQRDRGRAREGAQVAQVPHHTLLAVEQLPGRCRASGWASASCTGRTCSRPSTTRSSLPGYTRVDAAAYFTADAGPCACRPTSRTSSTRSTT